MPRKPKDQLPAVKPSARSLAERLKKHIASVKFLDRLGEDVVIKDFDVLMALGEICANPDTPLAERLKALTTLAEYIQPKLRGIETQTNIQTNYIFEFSKDGR